MSNLRASMVLNIAADQDTTGLVRVGAHTEEHCQRVGRTPTRVATDRGFWSPGNERALVELGVQKVSMPRRGKESDKRHEYERQSWFRRLQRWRAGQEATISVLKRRYGLDRTLFRGADGSRRWVGEAVWGYNLRRIAQLA